MPKLKRRIFMPLLRLLISFANLKNVIGYSQIASSHSNSTDEGPKIYRAMNLDLIFPQTFNSSENLISTTTKAPEIAIPPSWPSNYQAAIFVTPTKIEEEIATTTARSTQPTPVKDLDTSVTYEMSRNQQEVLQKQQQQSQRLDDVSSGRAVDYRTRNPFGHLITPQHSGSAFASPLSGGYQRQGPMSLKRPSAIGKLLYPGSHRNTLPIHRIPTKDQINHRFSPSEGVVSHQLKQQQQQHNHYSQYPSDIAKQPASSDQIASYVPPKELYSFPPNINAKYPSPARDPQSMVPTSSITSYLPPPSGPLSNSAGYALASNAAANTDGYKYPGPIDPSLMPSPSTNSEDPRKPSDGDGVMNEPPEDGSDATDDGIGVLPASAMDSINAGDDLKSSDMAVMNAGTGDDMSQHLQHHSGHLPLTGYDGDKEYPTPPPGWMEEHPEDAVPEKPHYPAHYQVEADDVVAHRHPPHPHHDVEFPSFPIYKHHHPEIIYDDHFFHHHHAEPPIITTTAPPPPAPEPRVKKYSYFYIGRKLWYIPLYFTVWFSFYVLWLILKSIARHKVNLPNHYVNRRSLPESSTSGTHKEYVDQLALFVLKAIDSFQENQRQ